MSERCCRTCTSFKWTEGKTGECRHDPPVPFMLALPTGPSLLGAPGKMNNVALQVRFPSSWPAVREEHWCRAGYEAKANGKEPEAEPFGS